MLVKILISFLVALNFLFHVFGRRLAMVGTGDGCIGDFEVLDLVNPDANCTKPFPLIQIEG